MKFKIITKTDSEGIHHHAVLVADNGEPLMWSENYADIRDAERCIELAASVTDFTVEQVFE